MFRYATQASLSPCREQQPLVSLQYDATVRSEATGGRTARRMLKYKRRRPCLHLPVECFTRIAVSLSLSVSAILFLYCVIFTPLSSLFFFLSICFPFVMVGGGGGGEWGGGMLTDAIDDNDDKGTWQLRRGN